MKNYTDFSQRTTAFLRKLGCPPRKALPIDTFDKELTEEEKALFGKLVSKTGSNVEGIPNDDELAQYLLYANAEIGLDSNNTLETIKKCVLFLTILVGISAVISIISTIIITASISSIF